MTKEELFKMMNEHPVMYVATNENVQPHVRAILMFKADADGIVFHTGVTKDLYWQLLADPRSEVCFACGKYQVRVEGKFELVEEMALKEEIVNHPSRKFLKPWREQQGDEAFFGFLKVFRMQHGKAHVWCMEDNFKPKEYIELQDMNEFMTPPKHVNFRAKKLFGAVGNIIDGAVAYMDLDGGGPTELHTHEHNHLFIVTEGEAKILLGDEEVIIHKDEAFLVEGRIPHSCWNNIEGVTKMIGITVI